MRNAISYCEMRVATQAPEFPYRANWNFEGTRGKLDCDADIPVRRWPIRTDSGRSCPWNSCRMRYRVWHSRWRV